jgi:hypothetical protein
VSPLSPLRCILSLHHKLFSDPQHRAGLQQAQGTGGSKRAGMPRCWGGPGRVPTAPGALASSSRRTELW